MKTMRQQYSAAEAPRGGFFVRTALVLPDIMFLRFPSIKEQHPATTHREENPNKARP